MAKVAIILSSYNGRKYIKEQIDSLLAQTHTDLTVFIRDDGSKDDTLGYLREVYNGESRIKYVMDSDSASGSNVNLGFGNSFSKALKYALEDACGYDYFAFCDQDDYWEPQKIASAVKALSGVTDDKLGMYASNYYVCDSKLNVKSVFNNNNPMDGVTFSNMFFEGVFSGFCIVINRRLAEAAFGGQTPDIFYHDKWVSLIALGQGGEIIYDKAPLAKYRRHDMAVSSNDLGKLAKLKWRINNVLNGDFCPRTKQMLIEYKNRFYDVSDDSIKVFLDTFTGTSKLRKLFYKEKLRRSASGEFLMKLILLTGKL